MYNSAQCIIVINTTCVVLCFDTPFLKMKTNSNILTCILPFIASKVLIAMKFCKNHTSREHCKKIYNCTFFYF